MRSLLSFNLIRIQSCSGIIWKGLEMEGGFETRGNITIAHIARYFYRCLCPVCTLEAAAAVKLIRSVICALCGNI